MDEELAENCGRGRGRPKKEESCKNVHTVRFDDDDEAKLDHLIVEEGGNTSEIMRKALRMYYGFRSKRW